MAKFKLFRSEKSLVSLQGLVKAGVVRLLHEKGAHGDRIFVLAKTGCSVGMVHPDALPEMILFVQENGAGDGLFPGFSQTTRLAEPIFAARS